MVNVSAQLPFNLHNQDNSSSRSSRNVSGGTLSSSRAATPSPSRKLHKSPSTASIRRDTLHYLPLVVSSTAPILNLRLVKSAPPTHTARGRSQRTGDQDSRHPALDSHPELSQDDGQTPRVPTSSTLKSHVSSLSLPCPRDCHEPYPSFLSTQKRHHIIPRTSVYMTLALLHVHGGTDHLFSCLHHVHFRTLPYTPFYSTSLPFQVSSCYLHQVSVSIISLSDLGVLRSSLPDMLSSTLVPLPSIRWEMNPTCNRSLARKFPLPISNGRCPLFPQP